MALVSKPLSIANVENGKSPFTHYAWAWNQLGTDRFTQTYPNDNIILNSQFKTDTTGWVANNATITVDTANKLDGLNSMKTVLQADSTAGTTSRAFYRYNGYTPIGVSGSIWLKADKAVQVGIRTDDGTTIATYSVTTEWQRFELPKKGYMILLWALSACTLWIAKPKVELATTSTIYTPAPSEDPTNAYPLYQGVYTDNTTTASTNPQKYTWQRIKGENGANGQDAPTVTAVQVEYTQSLDGVTPPTAGWTSTKPTPNMGYWQWQRVRDVFSNGTYGAWVATSVYYGRDAIIVSATEPTPKVDNMLWQKPTDPTVLRWNGSAWVEWGISVDNLVVDNATIENGVFKRIEGVEVIGSTIRNPYIREYLGGVRRDGEITLSEAEFKNSGKMYIDDVLKETYEQIISDRYIRMVRYRGDNFGDENNLIGSAALTFDTLTLVSKGEGVLDYGGSLTARQLTNTQWINLTYATGFRTSENNPCQYRLIYDLQDNPVVQFRGQVERTTGLMTGTTYPFTTLPPAIRTTKNVFKACTGDATELQTIRVGALKGDMGSVSNMIQVKAVGATQYVDISGLSYIVE